MSDTPKKVYIVEYFPGYGEEMDSRTVLRATFQESTAIDDADRIATAARERGGCYGDLKVTEIPILDGSIPASLGGYIERIIWSVRL